MESKFDEKEVYACLDLNAVDHLPGEELIFYSLEMRDLHENCYRVMRILPRCITSSFLYLSYKLGGYLISNHNKDESKVW